MKSRVVFQSVGITQAASGTVCEKPEDEREKTSERSKSTNWKSARMRCTVKRWFSLHLHRFEFNQWKLEVIKTREVESKSRPRNLRKSERKAYDRDRILYLYICSYWRSAYIVSEWLSKSRYARVSNETDSYRPISKRIRIPSLQDVSNATSRRIDTYYWLTPIISWAEY